VSFLIKKSFNAHAVSSKLNVAWVIYYYYYYYYYLKCTYFSDTTVTLNVTEALYTVKRDNGKQCSVESETGLEKSTKAKLHYASWFEAGSS